MPALLGAALLVAERPARSSPSSSACCCSRSASEAANSACSRHPTARQYSSQPFWQRGIGNFVCPPAPHMQSKLHLAAAAGMHLNCIQLRGMLLPKPCQLCCMASTLQCCTLLSFCLGRCRRRPLLLQQLHALLPLRCGIQLQLPLPAAAPQGVPVLLPPAGAAGTPRPAAAPSPAGRGAGRAASQGGKGGQC